MPGKCLASGFVRRTAAILSRTDSKMIPRGTHRILPTKGNGTAWQKNRSLHYKHKSPALAQPLAFAEYCASPSVLSSRPTSALRFDLYDRWNAADYPVMSSLDSTVGGEAQ
jgi:hypothetical protein